jgi:septal ring factor EnvC (AmiA/AmiB activator)
MSEPIEGKENPVKYLVDKLVEQQEIKAKLNDYIADQNSKIDALKAELRKSEEISIKCQENVYEQEGEIESLKAENAKFRKSLEDILNPNEGTNIHARMIAEHALGGVK